MSTPNPRLLDAVRELNQSAIRAMAANDFAAAQALLRRALGLGASSPGLWLNYAASCRGLADIDGALSAVDEALKLEPRSFMGLLMKGSLMERKGLSRKAASAYRPAVQLAPPEDQLDPATRQALAHARRFSERYTEEFAAFLNEAVSEFRERGSSVEARRIAAFIDISLGRKRHFPQEPSEYCYPGLPAIEFWDRDEFPWMTDFEATTDAIRSELKAVLLHQFKDFQPYVAYPDSVPLDQWAELNRSHRWGALHLYVYGERVEDNCRRCPATVAALDALPMPKVKARSPAAMFSALQPKTRIPPHTGVANTRLIVHLPLIVPPDCGFRVGNEVREWKEGQGWVFDDSIEHEAWNESELPRTILICDIWNPRLNATERALITRVIGAMDAFSGEVPAASL